MINIRTIRKLVGEGVIVKKRILDGKDIDYHLNKIVFEIYRLNSIFPLLEELKKLGYIVNHENLLHGYLLYIAKY